MKVLSLTFCMLLALVTQAGAHPFPEDLTAIKEHLSRKTGLIDPDAPFAVISEHGKVNIKKSKSDYVQHYTLHRLVKIYRTTGTDAAKITEVFASYEGLPTKVLRVTGTTYNLDNDKIKTTNLDKKAVETNRLNKHYCETKFSMPAITVGSVIDYTIEVEGPATGTLPLWEFKNGASKESESSYEVTAPAEYVLNDDKSLHIRFQRAEQKATSSADDFVQYTLSKTGTTSKRLWIKTQMKPLKPEPFVSGIENYRQVLVVQKTDAADELATHWKDLNKEMWNDEFFGKIASGNNARVQQLVDSVTQTSKTPTEKAHSIYKFVKGSFECNNNPGIYARRTLDQIFNNHIASEAEINLVLVAMIRIAKLKASPVIISRAPGRQASSLLPVTSQFNYTIAQLVIDGDKFLLDASNFFNPFGVPPIFCFNGYARVVDEHAGNAITLNGSDLKDNSLQQVTISSMTDASFIVEIVEQKGKTEATFLRNIFSTDTSAARKYVLRRAQLFPGTCTITDISEQNMQDPEKDLLLRYILLIKKNAGAKDWTISANLLKVFSTNPFTSPVRVLPIEFPSRLTHSYQLDIKVPSAFEPTYSYATKLGDVQLKGLESTHDISFDKQTRMLHVKSGFSIDRTTYQPDEYGAVQFFFNQMLNDESTIITLSHPEK